jgi:hypothetical protein
MIWQNPLALMGLAAIAIPVLLHLLSRRNARVERFPSLRFLPPAQSSPVRLTRITDPLLMVVRALIVAAAAIGLAQPLWRTANRSAAAGQRLARAVLIDTSASMRGTGTTAAIDSARRIAAALAGGAAVSVVVETASPATVLQGASSWLDAQSGRRELIVLSDFQTWTLDSIDLRSVSPQVGIRLERMPFAGAAPFPGRESSRRESSQRALTVLAGPASRADANAALRAASVADRDSTALPILVVFPDAPERSALIRDAAPIETKAFADAVVRLRGDVLVRAALARANDSTGFTAGEAAIEGRQSLVVFPSFAPGTLQSVALLASAATAFDTPLSPAERDPTVIPEEATGALAREPQSEVSISPSPAGASDGRWLWLIALLLIGVETLIRRRPGVASTSQVADVG